MFIKPKIGIQIKNPATREILPAEGAEVVLTTFWRRRLIDGDVLEATAEKAESKEIFVASKKEVSKKDLKASN